MYRDNSRSRIPGGQVPIPVRREEAAKRASCLSPRTTGEAKVIFSSPNTTRTLVPYDCSPTGTNRHSCTHARRQCWCGNVAFEFHGDPVDAKHCHCKQCQHLHGAPFQWAVIFPKVCPPPLLQVRALFRHCGPLQTSVRMVKNENDSLHFFSTERRQGVHDVPCKARSIFDF